MYAFMLAWTKVNAGHYVAEDGRYEIVRLPAGWEFSDWGSGYSGTAKTLREAKEAIESH